MKIALIGYGKMGKTIEPLAQDRGHKIALIIDAKNAGELTQKNLKGVDVAIEFSRPETAFDNISKCLEAGVPVISGTTAWLDRLEEARQLCHKRNGAFLYASNFSVGVNLFFEVNRYLAELMNLHPYDISLEEIHHLQKLDAPSGTAITLAEQIISNINTKKSWVNKATSEKDILPIISKREKDVNGTHIIKYDSKVDSIEIRHTAHSRKGFALGAISAAEWIIGKKGYFGMKDVLGFG